MNKKGNGVIFLIIIGILLLISAGVIKIPLFNQPSIIEINPSQLEFEKYLGVETIKTTIYNPTQSQINIFLTVDFNVSVLKTNIVKSTQEDYYNIPIKLFAGEKKEFEFNLIQNIRNVDTNSEVIFNLCEDKNCNTLIESKSIIIITH